MEAESRPCGINHSRSSRDSFFSDLLFSSKNFYFRDILNFHYPLRKALIDSYSRGKFPLWNPFIYLGQPMLANPNYMAFYPSNLLHVFLPFDYAFKLHFIIHPILGGLGAYFLQRRLGITPVAGLAGSVAYQFSGTVLSFLNLYNIVPAVALLPWIGWAFYVALKQNNLRRIFLFGLLLGLQAIAFEPLMFQCVVLLIAALATLHLIESEEPSKSIKTLMRVGFLGAFFGLGLAAIQVLPTLELLPLSARGRLDIREASRWSMNPLDFLNTLIPNLFGNYYRLGSVQSWGESIHEGREGYLVSFFLGACSLFLASLAFLHERKKLRLVFSALAFVSVFLALGRYNPVCDWFFRNVGMFSLGRYPSKYFLVGTLALSIMTSLGVEVAVKGAGMQFERRRIAVWTIGGLILAGVLLGARLYLPIRSSQLEQWLRLETGAVQSAFKDFRWIIQHIDESILSSGLFLLATSALVLIASRFRRGFWIGGLLVLAVSAELIPANLRLSPLMSEADIRFEPLLDRYVRQYGPAEPFRMVSSSTVLGPMRDFRIRAPNGSAAWLTLFEKMSGEGFYPIMDRIECSLYRPVDHLNTKESEDLWEMCMRLPKDSALTLLQKTNSPLILSLGELNHPRLRLLSAFDTHSEIPVRAYWLEGTIARAYFVSGVRFVNSPMQALQLLVQQNFPAGNTVILEGKGNPLPAFQEPALPKSEAVVGRAWNVRSMQQSRAFW